MEPNTTTAPGYIQGLVRTVLAVAGGFLIGKGWVTADQLPEIGGLAVAVAVGLWSLVHKANLATALQNAVTAGRDFKP
jgi:hypothetical protein